MNIEAQFKYGGKIQETLLHALVCFLHVSVKFLNFVQSWRLLSMLAFVSIPRFNWKIWTLLRPNTGRDFPGSKLLLHFFRELWSIGNKQLCRMGRQWVIPTSNRTSMAPKRHPKCIKCFTASIVGFGFKHSPPRTIEQRGLKSYIESSVVIPRAVGHPTPTPKRHYNIGIQ